MPPTQTICKKKANQQKFPCKLAENQSSYPLSHHLCFFGFPCCVQNGWLNPSGRAVLKKIALHTCINFQKTENSKPRHKSSQQTSTNINQQSQPDPASELICPINQWVSFCPSFRRFRGLLKEGAFAKRNDSSNSWGDVSGKFNDSMDVKAKSKPVHKRSHFKKELGKTSQFRFICALLAVLSYDIVI